jgi:hypothetical protein
MNFPAASPLRLYSVMPLASVRIVRPSFELDAVFTFALDPSLLAGAVAGALAEVEVLLALLELPPQPASSPTVASAGIRNFGGACMLLLCHESRGLEVVTTPRRHARGFLPSRQLACRGAT